MSAWPADPPSQADRRELTDFDHLLDNSIYDREPNSPRIRSARETAMAKGEQRGNREAKKPKKEKPKNAAPASPFASQAKGGAASRPSGGKR
jgi:hypothetical protein